MSADLFGTETPDRRAMGSHQSHSGGADEWLTPPDLIDDLGVFDLDPCAAINAPWSTASKHYTIEDDGLRQEWQGRVWLNPPYSAADRWLARMVEHDRGTALIFARTETRLWFRHVWPHASGLLFLRGRLHFHYASGKRANANSGAPSVLVAYGQADAQVLRKAEHLGQYVALKSDERTVTVSPVEWAPLLDALTSAEAWENALDDAWPREGGRSHIVRVLANEVVHIIAEQEARAARARRMDA